MTEGINEVAVINTRPSFSCIIPAHEDPDALARTLMNLIVQRFVEKQCRIEAVVVGDGLDKIHAEICAQANKYAESVGHDVKVVYCHLKGHSGTGNIPRNAGLKIARNDWVLFTDQGTGVCHDAIETVAAAIEKALKAGLDPKFIVWDVVQLTDPVPTTSTITTLLQSKRDRGLPYVIPGIGCAVRRDLAQTVDWPNVGPSDWAYFSRLWEKAFGRPEIPEVVTKSVVTIPWVLTVAYANKSTRRERWPHAQAEFDTLGYDQGYDSATSKLVLPNDEELSLGSERVNGDPAIVSAS